MNEYTAASSESTGSERIIGSDDTPIYYHDILGERKCSITENNYLSRTHTVKTVQRL